MHTKDILAAALEEAGLPEMAAKARRGWYHDFLSPLDLPTTQLAADLAKAGTSEALALRRRVMNGDFDASGEEAAEWARSAPGHAAMKSLLK